jgi:hypothetical protein
VFATDLAAGKWTIFADVSSVTTAANTATAAAAAASVSQGVATAAAASATSDASAAHADRLLADLDVIATAASAAAAAASAASIALPLSTASGGTGSATTAGARTNLGLAIGSNVQAWDADLDALAALAATAGMLARTGAGAFAVRSIAGTASNITVSNGDGAAGAPTIDLVNTAVTPATYTLATITVDAKGRITSAANGTSSTPGYINGFTLSNDSGTPNSVLDIALGTAVDSTGATAITGTAFTKSTAGTWVAGSGGNGMGQGLTIAVSTWYHVFAAIIGGAFDVFFDTSASAANKPASTTAFRCIGSFLTDGSAHIKTFTQHGQYFQWKSAVLDLNGGGATAITNVALSVPLGVVTFPMIAVTLTPNAAGNFMGVSSAGQAAADVAVRGPVTGQANSLFISSLFTDTSSQIRYITSSASDTDQISTLGWIDPRCAPNA